MDGLDLARWQFGITTVYHFLFVPVTIGLSVLVAILQTAWVRTDKSAYLRATKFWGTLLLINFAIGVATGIVQEFQFGMNWSTYSRFVGDIFGAPLAMEALIAFFLESTFLGLWIFGWHKLPKKLHLACIWIVAFGSMVSAYFILAANSFMQWPVGFRLGAGRAELADFGAVLSNKVVLATFPHTILGCWLAGGVLLMAISAWHLARSRDVDVFRPSLRLGVVAVLIGAAGTLLSGDLLGKVMVQTQPMKMAAAEALYSTERPASFSLLTIGTLSGDRPVFQLKVPGLLSYLSTGSFDGEVAGIDDIQAAYQQKYGPGDYRPYIPVTYWSFRLMIICGLLAGLVALMMLWLTRRGRLPSRPWIWRVAFWSIVLPFLAHSFGWIFTEMGRQPWIVFGHMLTLDGVSKAGGPGRVLATLVGFTLLYGVLAVIEVALMIKYGRQRPPEAEQQAEPDTPSFSY